MPPSPCDAFANSGPIQSRGSGKSMYQSEQPMEMPFAGAAVAVQ